MVFYEGVGFSVSNFEGVILPRTRPPGPPLWGTMKIRPQKIGLRIVGPGTIGTRIVSPLMVSIHWMGSDGRSADGQRALYLYEYSAYVIITQTEPIDPTTYYRSASDAC